MIKILAGADAARHEDLMRKAFELRHSVFIDELKWDNMTSVDGMEIDQFDTPEAVHMLALNGDDVVGYQRMLPTTQPHLLTDVFADLCEVDRPYGDHVWEFTRYCTARKYRESQQTEVMVRRELLHAAVQWALTNNISQFVLEMDPYRMLRLLQYHFRVVPLGLPKIIGGNEVIAATAHLDTRTLERLAFLRDNGDASATVGDKKLNRAFTRAI